MSNTPVQDNIRAYALDQVGAAYIMGATAEPCTPRYRRALANGRSSDYADRIIDNCPVLSGKQSSCDGCEYEDELSFDCAQLSKFAAAAGGVQLPSGSNSQWTKVDWAITGEIASLPMDVVCFVFHHSDKTGRMSHVGVYLGDGTVSDARGHDSGVLHKDVAAYPWTHYAIPVEVAREAGMDMSERPTYAEMRRDTIRKGSKGNAVAELQGLLNAWDPCCALEVDGKFGSLTEAAVKQFQAFSGLTVDGVAGPNTWCALLQLDVEPGEDGEDDTVTGDSSASDGDGQTAGTNTPVCPWDSMATEERTDWLLEAVRLLADGLIERGCTLILQDGHLVDKLLTITGAAKGGDPDAAVP